MSTQKAISGQPYKNNNSTILYAGNVTDSTTTNAVTEAQNVGLATTTMKPVVSSTLGNKAAITGRTFASDADSTIAKGIGTINIAGTADNTLRAPDADKNRPKSESSQITSTKTGFLTEQKWSMVSGEPMFVENTQSANTLTFGEDEAINSELHNGRIAFNAGAPTPTRTHIPVVSG
jgi:hypothetical protein